MATAKIEPAAHRQVALKCRFAGARLEALQWPPMTPLTRLLHKNASLRSSFRLLSLLRAGWPVGSIETDQVQNGSPA